jgi:hypothetical protein
MLAAHIKNVTYKQSHADPCLYYGWINREMVVFVAWVDDVMVLGPPKLVEQVQQDLEKAFMCKREGELTEYVGRKLTIMHEAEGRGTVKFTQPVLIKKLNEEYKVPEGPVSKTSAVAGQVIVKGDGDGTVSGDTIKMYWSATATCMFMMQWLHPNIFYAVHGLARHITAPSKAHVHALMDEMRHAHTASRPGDIPKEHVECWQQVQTTQGRSNCDHSMNPDDHRRILGIHVFTNDIPISFQKRLAIQCNRSQALTTTNNHWKKLTTTCKHSLQLANTCKTLY